MIQPEEELYKRMGEKAGMSGFTPPFAFSALPEHGTGRSISPTISGGFQRIQGSVETSPRTAAFLQTSCRCGSIRYLMYPLWQHRINGYLHKRNLMVEKELASVFHFPDSRYNTMPIIDWIHYKVLPPPPDAPQRGLFWVSTTTEP